MMVYLAFAASLVFLSRALLGKGYTPGHIWGYAWAFAWTCQGLLGAGYLLDSRIALFVGLCNVTFIIAAYAASPQRTTAAIAPPEFERREKLEASSPLRSAACALCILIALVALNTGLREVGHAGVASIFGGSFTDFSTSLVDTKSAFAVEGVWARSVGMTAVQLFLTSAAVLTGLECALMRSQRWKAAGLLLAGLAVVAFLSSAGTGVRTYLFITIVLFAASYLAANIYIHGGQYKFPTRVKAAGVIVLLAFSFWVVVVQSARRGDFSFSELGETLDYLRAWLAGYLPALSQWVAESDFGAGIQRGGVPGVNLVRGILSPLGLVQGEGFNEVVRPIWIGEGAMSNAMTIFRVLLLDFGYVGSFAACAVAGFIAQRLYLRTLNGSTWAIVPLSGVYAVTFYSFNYWLFNYGSRIVGIAIAFFVVIASTAWSNRSDNDTPTRNKIGEKLP